MLWILLAIGITGAILGATFKVQVLAVASVIVVVMALVTLTFAGFSVLFTASFIFAALTALQACYVLGAFLAAKLKSPRPQKALGRMPKISLLTVAPRSHREIAAVRQRKAAEIPGIER